MVDIGEFKGHSGMYRNNACTVSVWTESTCGNPLIGTANMKAYDSGVTLHYEGYNVKFHCRYGCEPKSGDFVRTCSSGHWSGTQPVCKCPGKFRSGTIGQCENAQILRKGQGYDQCVNVQVRIGQGHGQCVNVQVRIGQGHGQCVNVQGAARLHMSR